MTIPEALIPLALLLAACGRIGFSAVDVDGDGGVDAPADDAPTTLLVAHAVGASGGTVADTPAIDDTGATLLVACVSTYNNAIATTTISDSYANTWVPLQRQTGNTNNLQLYYVTNPITGTAHVFSASGGDGYPTVAVQAFAAATPALDGESGSVAPSTSVVQPGAVTPTHAADVFVSCVGTNSHTDWTSVTVSDGFAITDMQLVGAITSPEEIAIAYVEHRTGAALNPTWTIGGSDQNLNAVLAAFQLE